MERSESDIREVGVTSAAYSAYVIILGELLGYINSFHSLIDVFHHQC